ncbi:hypothetical protein SAY87_024903 [Trapa incisa]|uniref:Cyclin n=1 Tax=Trapa incisa TaxID=236973 RepID=A0AAN7GF29_9MYRT|nr:hypothetical protein SAY87_024903 [Trapa incisa]
MASTSCSAGNAGAMMISPRKLRSDLYSSPSYQDSSDSETPLVISVLSSLINRAVSRNERIAARSGSWAGGDKVQLAFDCLERPDMTVQSYLERISRYIRAGPSVYVIAYVYIDRFCQAHPGFRIGSRNVHRLLITTIMVASKYVEDLNYRNSHFARVGGLRTEEMNRLEMDFLFLMGFKLHVNVTVFESYCSHLEREVSIGGGYHIERALRCAEEIKLFKASSCTTTLTQLQQPRYHPQHHHAITSVGRSYHAAVNQQPRISPGTFYSTIVQIGV